MASYKLRGFLPFFFFPPFLLRFFCPRSGGRGKKGSWFCNHDHPFLVIILPKRKHANLFFSFPSSFSGITLVSRFTCYLLACIATFA